MWVFKLKWICLTHPLFCLALKGILKSFRNTNILNLIILYLVFVKGRLGTERAVVQLHTQMSQSCLRLSDLPVSKGPKYSSVSVPVTNNKLSLIF